MFNINKTYLLNLPYIVEGKVCRASLFTSCTNSTDNLEPAGKRGKMAGDKLGQRVSKVGPMEF